MIALLLSLLLATPVDLATSQQQALRCATETAWSERVDGGWVAVCGDAFGRAVEVSRFDPSSADLKADPQPFPP